MARWPLLLALVCALASAARRAPPRLPRRGALRLAAATAAAAAAAPPGRALINGARVSEAEAARAGVVGLYINMDGCTVCKKGLPAVCTGVLIGPRLVLSASHCLDVSAELGGVLTDVVFGTSFFDGGAARVPVDRYVLASEYARGAGGAEQGNDLMLIKLARDAPAGWVAQPLRAPARAAAPAGRAAGGAGAISADEISAGAISADEISAEYPPVELFGYGDTVDDDSTYSAGTLRRLRLQPISPVSRAQWLSMVLDKKSGTCSGDSGAAALGRTPARAAGAGGEGGRGTATRVLGVLSSNTMPCTGSNGLFVAPGAFDSFLRRGCRELGVEPPPL